MFKQAVGTLAARCKIAYPRHSTINHEVGAIHEAALITGQKEDSLGLLNSFAEATRWEVDLAAVAFGRVVT